MSPKLVCNLCKKEYDAFRPRWRCTCGEYLSIDYLPTLDLDDLKVGPQSLWRYGSVLPFGGPAVSIGESVTPLSPELYEGVRCYFKLDYLLPTGSYKDRGVSVMVSQFKNWGLREIVEDSSGNAAASLAAYCAKARIKANIYVPSYTSAGKLGQIRSFGANLILIDGTREYTADAAFSASEKSFYGSHNWSPHFEHGVKTYLYEIWEQLGRKMPDVVVAPCGNGSLITSAFLAAKALFAQGLSDRIPRLVAVQSENCAPLARAWELGSDRPLTVRKKDTAAEGISSATPLKGSSVLEAVKQTGGLFVTVSEDEIWEGFYRMADLGMLIEPTSAVAPAALKKLSQSGWLDPSWEVAVELTGNGLKALDKIASLY